MKDGFFFNAQKIFHIFEKFLTKLKQSKLWLYLTSKVLWDLVGCIFSFWVVVSIFVAIALVYLRFNNLYITVLAFFAVFFGAIFKKSANKTDFKINDFLKPQSILSIEHKYSLMFGFLWISFSLALLLTKINPLIIDSFYAFVSCLHYAFFCTYCFLFLRYLVFLCFLGNKQSKTDLEFLVCWLLLIIVPLANLVYLVKPDNVLEEIIWLGMVGKNVPTHMAGYDPLEFA